MYASANVMLYYNLVYLFMSTAVLILSYLQQTSEEESVPQL